MNEAAPRVLVLDYGMGNLRSVEKALERVGARAAIGADPEAVRAADGLVLPGVGAFPRAMERIRATGLDALLAERVAAGTPVLGICLGLQLLFERSEELGGATGLGLLPGEVRRLEAPGLKVPNIGWAPVRWERESRLTEGIPSETPFYLVHSFVARPAGDGPWGEVTLGTASYGERFACVVGAGDVYGVQFHPEKSSAAGLALLANFAARCGAKAPAPA